MKFESPLLRGRFLRRYKRFFADIGLDDGREIVAHCANPGAMLGIDTPGALAFVEPASNPKRKLAWTLEILQANNGAGPHLVGANTNRANAIAAEAVAAGRIPELAGYDAIAREVRYGEASRVDFLLSGEGRPPCYLEVKNVHLVRGGRLAEFPDCRTARGARHLAELVSMVRAGSRAAVLFIIQRADVDAFSPARDLDPGFAAGFDAARREGVEMFAMRCGVTPEAIVAQDRVPVMD
ncbi:MAG: DNA/RNA nuclease SfsA [Rhodobiaceae bacterium]|nr:DNA/RNA nuclease SfsA [Rhodobiaceae bacterium]MCC0055863.1 DNA/RNA nuclease SfsA [Rhodobiaceae bacterium]